MMNFKNFFDTEMCSGPIENNRFSIVESSIGVKFPALYKKIVKSCDGGYPLKDEFFYIDDSLGEMEEAIAHFLNINPSQYGDLLSDYESPPEFFPEGLVAFGENGGGDLICFDYRKGKDNPDPPVVFWRHDADIGKDVSFIANNFEEFIGMLREAED